MPDELPITAGLTRAVDAADLVVEVSGLRMSYDGFEAIRGIDLRVSRGGGTRVTINGAVARGKHPLATDPRHWTDALDGSAI